MDPTVLLIGLKVPNRWLHVEVVLPDRLRKGLGAKSIPAVSRVYSDINLERLPGPLQGRLQVYCRCSFVLCVRRLLRLASEKPSQHDNCE